MRSIMVNGNDSNQRIDKFLDKYLINMPKNLLYKYIRKKRINVNKKRVNINYNLKEGDIIYFYINDEFFPKSNDKNELENLMILKHNIKIIYEDNNILLIDKEPGILVHSAKPNSKDDLTSHLKSYLYKKGEYIPSQENTFAPAVCNRLDRNTGGIVIAAKNAPALRIINEQIRNKKIRRFYLCLVRGRLINKQGQLTGYITKNQLLNMVDITDSPKINSKQIITNYKVLNENNDDTSLLEIELITGRTHQIRAHLAHIGHPILGDIKYGLGKTNNNFKYQALYSYKIIFDFTDAKVLNYLKGKTFEIKELNIFL